MADALQQQIDQARNAQKLADAAKKVGQDFTAHLATIQQQIPGFEETIGRRNSDAQINQAEADRERAAAQQVAGKNPKSAQSHLNKANAAQKKADAAKADVQKATQARDEARSFLNTIVPASDTTTEARAFRGAPGAAAPAAGDGLAVARTASAAPSPAPTSPSNTVPTDPRAFQQYLNSRGANLVVDGVIGPKTRAAAQQFGVPLPGAQPAAVAPAAAPTAVPARPAVRAPLTPAQIQTQIKAQYGYLGALLDRPDVAQALTTAIAQDLAPNEALALLYQTPTWTQHQSSELNFLGLKTADQQAQITQQTADVAKQAKTLGVNIAPDRLTQIATDSLRLGWDPTQLNNAIAAEWHYQPGGQQGQLGQAEATLKQMANNYLVPLSDATLADWESQIAAGTATPESFRKYFIGQASSLYQGDGIAEALQGGATMQQLAEPYAQDAATELGINPAEVDFTQPKWLRALSSTDPTTGKAAMMGRADWLKTLRSDPTYGWDGSPNGVATGYAIGNVLTQALRIRP